MGDEEYSKMNLHGHPRNILKKIDDKLENLKKKLKQKNHEQILKSSDVQILREECCAEDPKIACVASDAIVRLVKGNDYPLSSAFTWFIALLQSGKCNSSIVRAISDLLLLNIQLIQDGQNVLNLRTNQHPLILILKQSGNFRGIEIQLKYMFSKQNLRQELIFSSVVPLFKYILWYQSDHKRDAWKFLISRFHSHNLQFMIETLSWFRTKECDEVLDVNHLITEYLEFDEIVHKHCLENIMCIKYAYISYKLAKHGFDPTYLLKRCCKLLREHPDTTDVVLIIFAEALCKNAVTFFNVFLLSCVELIEINGCANEYVLWMITSAILPWLMYSSASIVSYINESAETFFSIVKKHQFDRSKRNINQLLKHEWFLQFVTSECEIYWAFLIINWMENPNNIETLLEHAADFAKWDKNRLADCFIILNLFFSSILLAKNRNLSIQLKSLEVLVKINPGGQLPLILYVLSKTSNPKLQLKLLHSMPLCGVEKENIPLLLRSFHHFFSSGKPIISALSVELYITLWKTEERCYSYLHDNLLEFRSLSKKSQWETDVILAGAIKELCEKMPEKHGKQWIGTLSEIIKKYHRSEDCAPSTLALEAIIILCKADVLKVTSIYSVLAEGLYSDQRPLVIQKFYELIGFLFEYCSDKALYDHYKDDVFQASAKLWTVIAESSSNKKLTISAMSALSKYNKDEMPLKAVPEIYRKHVMLPKKYHNVSNPAPKSEDVLEYVPGDVWICFLQNTPQEFKQEACKMLTSWLSAEVDNFPKSLYASIRGEPKDFNMLPDKCLLKAIVLYLKKTLKNLNSIQDERIQMIIYCLQILNGNLPKHLPLFNWSFLEALYELKRNDLNRQIIMLFAKQSLISASSKNGAENYLKTVSFKNDGQAESEKLEIVLEALPFLCGGIPCIVLKPFFQNLERYLIDMNIDDRIWRTSCESFEKVLKNFNGNVKDENLIYICEVIRTMWCNIPYNSDVFSDLVEITCVMPITYIEKLSTPTAMDEISLEQVSKSIKLRCEVALKSNENPFLWLNDCIVATVLCLEAREIFFNNAIILMRTFHHLYSDKWKWLLQLMGYTQTVLDDSKDVKRFICDVFIWSVVNFSIYSIFVRDDSSFEDYFFFFPQALRSIVDGEISSQVVEWLHYMNKTNQIEDRYSKLFSYALMAMKYNSYLYKANIWSKIIL